MLATMQHFVAPDSRAADGFLLRSYEPDDGPALCRSANTTYEHLKTFMPWAKPEQTEEESIQLVRQFRARWLLSEDFVIGIWSPDNTELWGGCGYHLREGGLEVKNAEIGMWIHADQAGKGLGTAVLKELIAWGFSEWPWLRLTWRCDTVNVASIRVAEKVGMTCEGTLRDHTETPAGKRRDTVCYAILRS